ncbi:MAG: hypothetical protein KDC92_01570, partial [Bacteroidetes bacterium]|nr:hypothetical protein [Bacteroidota bacterium]
MKKLIIASCAALMSLSAWSQEWNLMFELKDQKKPQNLGTHVQFSNNGKVLAISADGDSKSNNALAATTLWLFSKQADGDWNLSADPINLDNNITGREFAMSANGKRYVFNQIGERAISDTSKYFYVRPVVIELGNNGNIDTIGQFTWSDTVTLTPNTQPEYAKNEYQLSNGGDTLLWSSFYFESTWKSKVKAFALVNGKWQLFQTIKKKNANGFAYNFCVSGNGKKLAISDIFGGESGEGAVHVYRIENGQYVEYPSPLIGDKSNGALGKGLRITPDGKKLMAYANGRSSNGTSVSYFQLYKVSENACVKSGESLNPEFAFGMETKNWSINADASKLAASARAAGSFEIKTFEFDGTKWQKSGKTLNGYSSSVYVANCAAISPDGNYLVYSQTGLGANYNEGIVQVYVTNDA